MNRFCLLPVSVFLLFLFSYVMPTGTLRAQDRQVHDSFTSANQAYLRGQYADALTLYRQTAEQAGYSAALLYNMGNCLARMRKNGPAVLAYEQARFLAPFDPDVRTNLALLRARVNLPDPQRTWWHKGAALLNADQWLMASAALLAASVLLLFGALVGHNRWPGRFIPASLICLSAALLMAACAVYGYRYIDKDVLLMDAPLRISPFQEAAGLAELQAGQLVKSKRQHGKYVLIRTEDGRKGWVEAKYLARISDLGSGLVQEDRVTTLPIHRDNKGMKSAGIEHGTDPGFHQNRHPARQDN